MTGPPSGRCGYLWPEDFDPDNDPGPAHQSSCWRETWRNYDRCIWHTKTYGREQKPTDELKEYRETPKNRKLNRKSKSPAELLDGAHLFGVDLRKVGSFRACAFRKGSLDKANLSGADLARSSLINATLIGAILSEANLRSATLFRANLRSTNLSGANLQRTTLYPISCADIDVTGVIMDGKTTIEIVDLQAPENRGSDRDEVARAAHAFREAAVDNGLRPMARQLRYRERVERRREAYDNGFYFTWIRSWLSAWVTGYGVYLSRIAATMLGVALLFGLGYWALGMANPLQLSVETFIPRGIGDPSPMDAAPITPVEEFISGRTDASIPQWINAPSIVRALMLAEAFIGTVFTVLISYVLVTRDSP